MCGIAGLFSLTDKPINAAALAAGTERIRHRGPDDGAVVLFAPGQSPRLVRAGESDAALAGAWRGGLGHRRLSILDLATGAQPMQDATGRHWIAFNGEIYNYRSIRAELESRGVRFTTASDTEVLLQSLIVWGRDALPRLEGMFAFAWWDATERRLLLARDRFGIKPLFYATTPDGFAFASEIKGIPLYHNRTIDREALRDFLVYRYVPGPRTIYSGVLGLPPGCLMEFRPGEEPVPEPRAWYTLSPGEQDNSLTLDAAAERLDELLAEVCRDHLIADVPVGVFLSGGLDSSAILAHSQAAHAGRLQAVSVGFEGREKSRFNELDAAREIANHIGSDLHVIQMRSDVLDALPGVCAAMDQPLADPSCLPVYRMMEAARSQAKVMLSGDGGDEVLGGYNRYIRYLRPESRAGGAFRAWLQRNFMKQPPHEQALESYSRQIEVFEEREAESILRPEYRAHEPFVPLWRRIAGNRSRGALIQIQEFDMHTYLADDNLRKTDSASMAFGLEVRVPMLDRRIVEFGLSLPRPLRISRRITKVCLRESLARSIPRKILDRKKIGFKVPLESWFRRPENTNPLTPLLDPQSPVWTILDRSRFIALYDRHRWRLADNERQLYAILVLDAWLRGAGALK